MRLPRVWAPFHPANSRVSHRGLPIVSERVYRTPGSDRGAASSTAARPGAYLCQWRRGFELAHLLRGALWPPSPAGRDVHSRRALDANVRRISAPNNGLTDEELAQLPSRQLATCATEACAICQETPLSGDTLFDLACGHSFHVNCIYPWLQRIPSCPTCRKHPLHPDPPPG